MNRYEEQRLIEAAHRFDRAMVRLTLVLVGPWSIWFLWQVFQGLAAKGMLPWQG